MTPVRILIAAVLAAAAAACAPYEPQSLNAPVQLQTPPEGWARADEPVVWNRFDEAAQLELSIPEAVKRQPRLYSTLRSTAVAELRTFGREARDALDELGPEARTPYTLIIGYSTPVETDGLFSLEGGSWTYTGGAHGNPVTDAVLWDKTGQRLISSAELFAPGADMTVLDRALCDAVNAEKARRTAADRAENPTAMAWEPVSLTPTEGQIFACPKALDIPMALARGTASGKAGGLVFLIPPYVVGPYVESTYDIVVPAGAFAALLSPEWAGQFAGSPAPDSSPSARP